MDDQYDAKVYSLGSGWIQERLNEDYVYLTQYSARLLPFITCLQQIVLGLLADPNYEGDFQMYEITEKIVKQYVVTCPDGEVTFEKEDTAHAFVQLHNLARPLTMEQIDEGIKGTPEQVAAWSAIGSCPNCGGNLGNGDLELEHLDGDCYAAECYVCGTKFDIIEGKSEV